MKKLFYSFAMLALLVGCSTDDPAPADPTPAEIAYTATVEAVEGADMTWSANSKISVFRSIVHERFGYNADTQNFTKEDKIDPKEAYANIYAVSPYKSATRVAANGELKFELPATQTYVPGSFNFAENPMVAVTADAKATEFEFKNLCGYVEVKLFGTAAVSSVAINGANGEDLAGTITATMEPGGEPVFEVVSLKSQSVAVSCAEGESVTLGATEEEATSFYIMVPPTTFDGGYTITVTDSYGNVRKKNFKVDEENPAITVGRSQVVNVATYELAEKKPLQTILNVQFNEDGTATDTGIYNLEVQKVGDISPYVYTYKHPDFKANNIAHFMHMGHNEYGKKHSYYKVDYAANEEMLATMADGFSLEIVTYGEVMSYDWWSCPVGSDAFRIFRKGDLDGNEMFFNINSDGAWWPYDANAAVYKTSTVFEKNKYIHTTFVYDADNQTVSIYNNAELVGLAEGVAEFKVGRWLTIGGYVESEAGDLMMQWNGEVALVKMYDQAMTYDEIAASYTALKLPEAPAAPAPAALSTPLFDIKWNADKNATNAGTQTSLNINSKPSGKTSVQNVDGFGYVVNFNEDIHNGTYGEGWYRIDYTNDEDFKNKLRDGFSFEVVCLSNFDQGQFWMRPASSNKWGFMLRDGGHKRWATYANHGDNSWGACGNLQQGGYHVYWDNGNNYWPAVNKMTSFAHIVYVYNAEAKEFGTFVNGHWNGGKPEGNFDVGSVLNVNGIPYINGEQMAHGWNGKVAIVRVYDEAMTQDQVVERYKALQPTIEKLNTLIAE